MVLNKELIKRCFERCNTEEERDIVRYVVDDIERSRRWNVDDLSAERLYGSILYQAIYGVEDFSMENGVLLDLSFCFYVKFHDPNMLLMDELLQLIDFSYPEARKKGIEMVSDARKLLNEKTFLYTKFLDYGVAMNQFPEGLKREIEKEFAYIRDDIHIVYTTSWDHSHLDYADVYGHKSKEFPVIKIYFFDENSRKEVENILRKKWNVYIQY